VDQNHYMLFKKIIEHVYKAANYGLEEHCRRFLRNEVILDNKNPNGP
jgi:hypothetical protein